MSGNIAIMKNINANDNIKYTYFEFDGFVKGVCFVFNLINTGHWLYS